MKTRTREELHPSELVQELLNQAMASLNERREEQRYPYFRPVTITISGPEGQTVEGFSKDISESGMGLLTRSPLSSLQRVSLLLDHDFGSSITLTGEVVWTSDCGKGWYTSGIRLSKK